MAVYVQFMKKDYYRNPRHPRVEMRVDFWDTIISIFNLWRLR